MTPTNPTSYTKELQIACLTIQRASLLTKKLLEAVDKGTIDKSDDTPVTIADFAAQALIIGAIHHAFPDDDFVGEEDSHTLRADPGLLERTWELVSSSRLDDGESEALLYAPATKEEMLDLIDLGAVGKCGSTGRTWVLDPVDGTATFMKGQQYAVCLALVEDGRQRVGVLGCPNLKISTPETATTGPGGRVHEDVTDATGYGHQIFAVEGQGASIRKMGRGALLPASQLESQPQVTNAADLHFVDCAAATSWNLPLHGKVATRLGAHWPHQTDLWAAQMRYVAIAVGGASAMVKIPRKPTHRSKIWDHAGGMLIATELGNKITDLEGNPVDCSLGRTLAGCCGMIVAPISVHGLVVQAVRDVIAEESG